jgi:serine/threonine-protein kinase
MTQHDAEHALKSAGFKVGGVTEEASSSVPDGEVIRQDPKDGVQYALGRSVDLVVSAGKGTVTVPDLTCLQTAKATTKLAGLGLSLNIVLPTSPNPACPHANRVGSQDTAPGTEVPPGTTIDVHVAGP